MMASATASPSLAPPEASSSFLNSATSSRRLGFFSKVAGAGAGGGVRFYRLRLSAPSSSSSASSSSSSSSSSFGKNGPNGFEFGEVCRIRIGDRRGERRWKASPAKDSSGDVLQTDPAETSRPRLTISRSEEEQEEDNESQGIELAGEEEGLADQERVLKTDTFLSSEASDEEASPSDTGKRNQEDGGGFGSTAAIGTVAAGLGMIGLLGGFGAVGYLYKDQVNEFLIQFSEFIEGYGPAGYGLFVLVYAGLELLAIPAIPLTMSAGLLFGAAIGTIIVSIAGTIAATGAFLISRYLARDRLLAFAKGNKKFLAIDKAIGDDGFRVVTLLRLSPLLPFSLGNYLYGLTSVKLGPYVLGSWLGMLPGSWAYVSAGAISRTFIVQSESEPLFSGGPEQLWTLGLGIAATVFAATYVTRIAKEALKDIED